ncbi:MAG: hypothetical protein M1419_10630 [Bacteroidetes bacterium]|nr:hypothetical protein [Bacteroidota bacterium]
MTTLAINWKRIPWRELNYVENSYFYMYITNKKPIYIGVSYKQHIVDEIYQTLESFNYRQVEISLYIGYIQYGKSTIEKISKELVKDSECLLIYCNQPRDNIQCKENYTGRDNLKVICNGTSYLYKVQNCQNKQILVR